MIRKRNKDIDILKGIGIISVVIGHALNTEIFKSDFSETMRKFVYIYHLGIFFFCSGYLFKVSSVVSIVRKLLKQYRFFVLVCLSSFLFLPLWEKYKLIEQESIMTLFKRLLSILMFRQEGYYVGAMWFVPFLLNVILMYSVISLLLKNFSDIYLQLTVLLLGVIAVILVEEKGIGFRYIYISLLMLPVLNAGRLYRCYEEKVEFHKYSCFVFACSILIINFFTKGEVELSKGEIYFGFGFYPMMALGICFCLSLKELIKKDSVIANFFAFLGLNSAVIMAYHFIAFKLFDVFISFLLNDSCDNIRFFPISYPNLRFLYIIVGVFIPLIFKKSFSLAKGVFRNDKCFNINTK